MPAGLLALAAALVPSGPARADPAVIPTVNITPAGPDKQLPTSGAFYLEGDAPKDVDRVYPVFVRISYQPWGISGASTCQSVSQALKLKSVKVTPPDSPPAPENSAGAEDGESGGKNKRKERPREQPLLETHAGIQSINSLWDLPDGATPQAKNEYVSLVRWGNAYVPDHWARTAEEEGKDVKYKVAVSSPSFFRPGATYCLLVYRQKTESKEVAKLPEMLVEHQAKALECRGKGRCLDAENQKLMDAVNGLLGDVSDEDKKKEVKAFVRLNLFGDTKVLASFESELTRQSDPANWKPKPLFADAEKRWSPPRESLDVRTDYLGRLIAELLAENHDLLRVVEDKRVEYRTRENEDPAKIDKVHLSSHLSSIELFGKKKGKDFSLVLKVPASSLPIAGVDLKLDEVLELARGRLRTDAGYKPVTEIASSIVSDADALGSKQASFERISLDKVKGLRDRVVRLRKGVREMCDAAGAAKKQALDKKSEAEAAEQSAKGGARKSATGSASKSKAGAASGGTSGAAQSELKPEAINAAETMPFDRGTPALAGLFLEDKALGKDACKEYTEPEPEIETGSNPERHKPSFLALETLLETGVAARASWEERAPKLKVTVSRVLPPELITKATVEVRFTQQTFVDNYVTPFVGRATLVSPTSDIGITYVGVQVYLWPNPVNEPMWTNCGGDLRRAFALELGAGLEGGDFGENDRYSGPWVLPPLFAGVAFQFAPYVTFSSGISLIERRKSALAKETPELFPSGYVALTAQVNFVGIIRNAFSNAGVGIPEAKKE